MAFLDYISFTILIARPGDIFDATHGFQKELGSRYTFLDIACAPGVFFSDEVFGWLIWPRKNMKNLRAPYPLYSGEW